MLDTDTKRRIDTARDILVGKVPDPKSQVEQITIALIYKFMDDMDADAEELGGKRKFFTGEFARYGWAKLMSAGIGGHELIGLYGEGISTMPQNPGIPALFRDIFKNAYLPYRDPETLKSFLKIIDEFSYDHSERLGDAFEYLLSVLGSQGDAGQFRTPRHIIDFMVEVMAPKKGEAILDPACGTAGFLISAWKHILRTNSDAKGHSTLTPDEKGRLATNFKGYDISPDMVRLSLVNLYLHGFTDPHIYEYDTLTSEDRWNEFADVILANPPFMSPKGGIKPHKRFSIQAKRSEVLFVDYMAEHLTPTGRAGIIVPEGIIFQSQTAYKDLRKMLVENSLVAVISLPAGVFQPYSGVKTSILILDKSLAKQTDTIAFFKVENDGFGLGAQRRATDGEQLTQVQAELAEYLRAVRSGQAADDLQLSLGLVVAKEKIAVNGDYNLSGERYREGGVSLSKFQHVLLGEICEVKGGKRLPQGEPYASEKTLHPYLRVTDFGNATVNTSNLKYITEEIHNEIRRYTISSADVYITIAGTIGLMGTIPDFLEGANLTENAAKLIIDSKRIDNRFLALIGNAAFVQEQIASLTHAVGVPKLSLERIKTIQIPLPLLDVQKEIVAEIEGYQRVINGARAVLDNYRPHIPIDPEWPIFELSEVTTKITDGAHFTPTYVEAGVPFLRVTDITESNTSKKFIPQEEHNELIKRCRPEKGDVLYSKNGTIGIAKLVDWDWEFSIFVSLCLIKPKKELLDPHYLKCFLNSDTAYAQATARSKSGTVTNLHLVDIKTIKIPLPPLATQQAIVAEIEAEQALVNANRELIERFEKKIQATLARVWGEETGSP